MTKTWAAALTITAGLALAGCSINAGSLSPLASAPPTPAAPAPVVYGAFLDGPVGAKLGQGDRDKALAAEQDALETGQRKTWKGEHGTFGYVEPAPAPAVAVSTAAAPATPPTPGDTCRGFASTIYIGGRPQTGHGTGCLNPDGTYHIAS